MRLPLIAAAFLVLALPQIALSQGNGSIAVGSRVRITQASTTHWGTVARTVADSVVLRLEDAGEPVAFSVASVSKLELSTGLITHKATRAQLGFLVGGAAGALALSTGCDCTGGQRTGVAIEGGILGGVVGALAGVAIGSRKTEKWIAVPPNRWRISSFDVRTGAITLRVSTK